MGKYVFEYYDTKNMSKEDSMPAWNAWFGEQGDKVMDAGNPFADGGQAVEPSGVTTIENWPCTGYTIVKAESMDEAVAMAKSCPVVASGGTVRVYEALPM